MLDLNEVVQGMRSLLRRLIGEHIALVASLEPQPMLVRADRGQLQQVIINLAVNARDAMPAGGILTIATAAVELGPSFVVAAPRLAARTAHPAAVTDTGMGMDAETRGRVFEPFFTTKEVGKGSGLGLATVYGIVKQSGGYIAVSSEPTRGSAFTVYLPRVTEGARDAPGVAAGGAGRRGRRDRAAGGGRSRACAAWRAARCSGSATGCSKRATGRRRCCSRGGSRARSTCCSPTS